MNAIKRSIRDIVHITTCPLKMSAYLQVGREIDIRIGDTQWPSWYSCGRRNLNFITEEMQALARPGAHTSVIVSLSAGFTHKNEPRSAERSVMHTPCCASEPSAICSRCTTENSGTCLQSTEFLAAAWPSWSRKDAPRARMSLASRTRLTLDIAKYHEMRLAVSH